MASNDLTMSADGLTAYRNGLSITKPNWMGEDHWFKHIAPRVGKWYSGNKGGYLFGADAVQPTHGVEERGEGCDGGACAI